MKKILIIQTAFIGDVILATALVEKLSEFHPLAEIDFLLRKGNESLLENNPKVKKVIVWDKSKNKFKNLLALKKQIRSSFYDVIISVQRFASSGYLVARSGAKHKIGFKGNPFSFSFNHKVEHSIASGLHETERNQLLIAPFTDENASKPKLYPSSADYRSIEKYTGNVYVCMAPVSVWKTKQLPKQQWLELIQKYKDSDTTVFLLGGPSDTVHNEYIQASAFQDNVINLSGELTFLESVALMQSAKMNYVNDSGPLHMASAVNAPVTVFYCSTVPQFGFGPLSEKATVIESLKSLPCRPCGLHGKNSCPKKHFDCGNTIELPAALS